MSDGARVDLSAARAARREAKGEGPVFVVDGTEFTGYVELPLAFVDFLREARFTDALKCVFGPRAEEFIEQATPTLDDLMEIAAVYGASLPSSLASRRS